MTYQLKSLATRLRVYRSEEAHRDVVTLFSLLPGQDRSVRINSTPVKKPGRTHCTHLFEQDLLFNAILSKYIGFKKRGTREAAKKKFLFYEARCGETNSRIRGWREGSEIDPFLSSVMFTAQKKISKILGSFSMVKLLELSRWGPRTTSSCKGLRLSAAEKFASSPETTASFLPRARLLMPLLPSWSAALADCDYGTLVNPMYKCIKGNRITFVPKTSAIDRVIAVEPHINSFFSERPRPHD